MSTYKRKKRVDTQKTRKSYSQLGGKILETEDEFFSWVNDDKNIENLLKSTVALLQHKRGQAKKIVDEEKKKLEYFYSVNLKVQTKGEKILAEAKGRAFQKIPNKLEQIQITEQGTAIKNKYDNEKNNSQARLLGTMMNAITNVGMLDELYDRQINEICTKYFSLVDDPEKYKVALDTKRKQLLEKVNNFVSEFSGDSNRRHRLFILNYAIDFAQNWTSFVSNYKLNIILTGGAGLGKTTFAKAIGPLFYQFGLLAKDTVNVREKPDFISGYVGQTQLQTYDALYSGLESVIFIDEAYSVSGCGRAMEHDYGQEFIDALVDVTQKSRGLFSIIAAGYKMEMHSCFLDKNPGMRRRFPNELELTPYSITDLEHILLSNILRQIFPKELTSALSLEIYKEKQIYFSNESKYKEFVNEIRNRILSMGADYMPIAQKLASPSPKDQEDAFDALQKKLTPSYELIRRYRSRVLGMYRFILMLSSFDTSFSDFETMFSVHKHVWNLVTENDPNKTYKFNMYRLLHIIYLSNHQKKREILKSYILREYFSEKEGSLFPSQAGDMGTLSGFILTEPDVVENRITNILDTTKLFAEYFRTRGGSQYVLKAKRDPASPAKVDVYIYYTGGGFVSHIDFERTIIQKLLQSLVPQGSDPAILWKLNAQPQDVQEQIVQKINQLYADAVSSLYKDSITAKESRDATTQAQKRLPPGIDLRFLEAEVRQLQSMGSGDRTGKSGTLPSLNYVNTDDYADVEDSSEDLLRGLITDSAANSKPTITLDIKTLCKGVSAPPAPDTVAAPTQPAANLGVNTVIPPPALRNLYSLAFKNTLRMPTVKLARSSAVAMPPPPPEPTNLGYRPPDFLYFIGPDIPKSFEVMKMRFLETNISKPSKLFMIIGLNPPLVDIKDGYYLFSVTHKIKKGEFIYKLVKSKKCDTPTEIGALPWAFQFIGTKNDLYFRGVKPLTAARQPSTPVTEPKTPPPAPPVPKTPPKPNVAEETKEKVSPPTTLGFFSTALGRAPAGNWGPPNNTNSPKTPGLPFGRAPAYTRNENNESKE